MKALAAQGLPRMASVPAVTAFELSRYADPQAGPSQLKQGDFPHKHAPLMPYRAACGSNQLIQAANIIFSGQQ